MTTRRSLALAGGWILAAMSSAFAQLAPLSSCPTDAQQRANVAISREIQTEIDAGRVSGAVTLVAQHGEIVHHGVIGLANIERDAPMQPDTLFAVASMTKPISATALMILVDDGKVALDDPVSKFVPQFAQIQLRSGEPTRPITVFDVLTHTSGLHGDQKVEGSLAEHMDVLVERGLAFEPGSQWQYSPGLNVCGRIIEVVSGESFDKFVRDRILVPLGMNDSSFFPSESQRAHLATIYEPGAEPNTLQPGTHWLHDFSSARVANPSGGLISNARDMAKFYQMILAGGVWRGQRIVSRESISRMTTLQTGDLETGFTPGNGWGLGWCVVREPQGVTGMLHRGTYGHGGLFGTQGWIDPTTHRIYVLMIQRQKLGNADGSDLRKRFQQASVDQLLSPTPVGNRP